MKRMIGRLFWVGVGVGLGIMAVAKAKSYIRAHTPDGPRQFVLGPDSESDELGAKTLSALVDQFKATMDRREAELTARFLKEPQKVGK